MVKFNFSEQRYSHNHKWEFKYYNVFGSPYSTPPLNKYIQGDPVTTSLVKLPVDGNWQKGVSPDPITINPPANLSPDNTIIFDYLNDF